MSKLLKLALVPLVLTVAACAGEDMPPPPPQAYEPPPPPPVSAGTEVYHF